jgi:hypothetical protein
VFLSLLRNRFHLCTGEFYCYREIRQEKYCTIYRGKSYLRKRGVSGRTLNTRLPGPGLNLSANGFHDCGRVWTHEDPLPGFGRRFPPSSAEQKRHSVPVLAEGYLLQDEAVGTVFRRRGYPRFLGDGRPATLPIRPV